MKISSLRRLAAKRIRSTPRQRAAAPPLTDEGLHVGDARRRHIAVADFEAPSRLTRRLVGDAQHGALCCDWGKDTYEAQLDSFMEFYEEKLAKLKEDEGGKDHICISGNLYMYSALANFADATGLFQKKQSLFVKTALFLVMFVQIFAPLGMLVSALVQIKFGCEDAHHECLGGFIGVHEFGHYQKGNAEYGLSHLFQRLLGLVFLVLFLMNGFYVMHTDKLETRKVTEMAFLFESVANKIQIMDHDGNSKAGVPPPRTCWLWVGALMNSACLMLCSWAMVFMFIIEEGPKDVVLDAFGLAFLYNLDDIGGCLAFLDEKWDEEFLGDVYGEMQERDEKFLDDAVARRHGSMTADCIYYSMNWVCSAMLIIQPMVYIFVEMKPKGDNG